MTEKDIKTKAQELTRKGMEQYGTPEFYASISSKWAEDNARVSHSDFTKKALAKKMGIKFMISPQNLLSGSNKLIFNILVFSYFILPLIACPIWAWHEKKWYLVFGVLISFLTQLKSDTGKLFFFIALILWVWLGIHNPWTYFFLCAAWTKCLFNFADEYANQCAINILIKNENIFNTLASTGKILVTEN